MRGLIFDGRFIMRGRLRLLLEIAAFILLFLWIAFLLSVVILYAGAILYLCSRSTRLGHPFHRKELMPHITHVKSSKF